MISADICSGQTEQVHMFLLLMIERKEHQGIVGPTELKFGMVNQPCKVLYLISFLPSLRSG